MLQQEPVKQSLWQCLRRDTHWKCLVLTIIIHACIGAILWCTISTLTAPSSPTASYPHRRYLDGDGGGSGGVACQRGYDYIPVAFVVMLYLVYLVECWHCHTRLELRNKVDASKVYERIRMLRDCVPFVWWKAVCYHYVRRTRQVTRYRNGDAFTSTQVYYERVNSHTATSAFNFSQCGLKDISRDLVNLEIHPATKIQFSKGFSFANYEAEREFEDQRSIFFHEHEHRDDYMETREGLDLVNVNFNEYMIAFADPDNLPWYVSHAVFWIISALLLSWPLRVLIEYKTAYVNYHVHKLFGCNYLDPDFVPNMTRVNTMESSELELTIRNNYTIVPSYSEALLMDSGSRPPSNPHLSTSMSFHSDYVHIPGTNTYAGYGGYVMTNGIAHAVSGPIPMSLSSGSMCRIIANHSATMDSITAPRGKHRKRKRRRRGTVPAAAAAEAGGTQAHAENHSSSTLSGYQRTADAPSTLPPSESCPESLREAALPPPTPGPPHNTPRRPHHHLPSNGRHTPSRTHYLNGPSRSLDIEHTPSRPLDIGDTPSRSRAIDGAPPSAITPLDAAADAATFHTDAPPSYELAICDPSASLHSLSPTHSPPYRLIETSL